MAVVRELTELEGVVLGTIQAKGPCTPYAVRREFQISTTPYWSGSAGAIYPLIARLTRRKLIRAVRPTDDGRGGTLYTLTAAGERAFLRWLGPPLSPLTVGSPPDPVRTRVGFFGLLPPETRRAFLAESADKIRRVLANLETVQDTIPDPYDRLALRGCVLAMEARLTWLAEVAAAIDKPTPNG